MPPFRLFVASRLAWLLAALTFAPITTRAALQDEIQVYDDAINKPKEIGLELHVNTTPSSRVPPAYPGEVVSLHGLRVTGEFSYGVTPDFEVGLYVPTVWSSHGHGDLAGLKLRAKYMPWRPDPETGGWYGGVNFELAKVQHKYEEATTNSELKLIGGHRSAQWLFAGNLNFESDWSGPNARHRPGLDIALKATREVVRGIAPGLEYYVSTGPVFHADASHDQDRRVYAVVDVDRAPWVFNVGVGRGMTPASDKWTLKAIFEIPLSR